MLEGWDLSTTDALVDQWAQKQQAKAAKAMQEKAAMIQVRSSVAAHALAACCCECSTRKPRAGWCLGSPVIHSWHCNVDIDSWRAGLARSPAMASWPPARSRKVAEEHVCAMNEPGLCELGKGLEPHGPCMVTQGGDVMHGPCMVTRRGDVPEQPSGTARTGHAW